ncbi:MAG: hypothetical protein COV76_06430 [Candidatus Omnitrophica bacterium CG11_big_fil_rev_8_21_14_0_20_64_10]|nr:MAG: hypothetical protein COV76_06430 [Candidatus Omnitrophica bacterium CG11_big_fil_rev_8_21_14_0_20_64_10]
MWEALDYPFFQRALAAGLLASIACGIVGTYVVVKRMASISGGLSHAAFGGVGLGYFLGFDPMWGAVGFTLGTGLALGWAARRLASGLDTLIAMVWSVGMALGILLTALTPGYAPDLMSYLFGSILFVPPDTLTLTAGLDALILLTIVLLYKELKAIAFDENFAESVGLPVEPLFLILIGLTSLAIVTLIRVVGIILVIALLTIPAAAARHWAGSLARMMALACGFGALCTTAGLFLAYGLSARFGLNVPTGPLIILLAVGLYAVSAAFRRRAGRCCAPAPL